MGIDYSNLKQYVDMYNRYYNRSDYRWAYNDIKSAVSKLKYDFDPEQIVITPTYIQVNTGVFAIEDGNRNPVCDKDGNQYHLGPFNIQLLTKPSFGVLEKNLPEHYSHPYIHYNGWICIGSGKRELEYFHKIGDIPSCFDIAMSVLTTYNKSQVHFCYLENLNKRRCASCGIHGVATSDCCPNTHLCRKCMSKCTSCGKIGCYDCIYHGLCEDCRYN